MREVLKNIDNLVSLLEEKLRVTDVYNQQLVDEKRKQEDKDRILAAKEKRLEAMERVYTKYSDFDKEKNDLAEKVKAFNDKITNAQKQEENDAVMLKQIKEENTKLDARKLALDKQAIALKEKEENFKNKQDDLKKMLSGEALKEILK